MTHAIIGVLPRGFAFPGGGTPDIYSPVPLSPAMMASSPRVLSVIGRLRAGITLEQAHTRLEAATRRLNAVTPLIFSDGRLHNARDPNWVAVIPLQAYLARDHRTALTLMIGAALLMLVIVCANVANLFLARASSMQREIAVRAALGASRLRLLRLLIAESLMLSAAGGFLGVALAQVAAPTLRFLLPEAIPPGSPLDWRALLFTAAVTIAAALIVGLAPAVTARRLNLSAVIKGSGPAARPGGGRLQSSLAVAQIALSLALLAGAGLLLRSFVKLVRVDLGFDPGNVLLARMNPAPGFSYDPDRRAEQYRQALAAVTALPEVEAVGLGSQPPVTGFEYFPVTGLRSEAGSPVGSPIYACWASPEYFPALRIPLLAGRVLRDSDGPDGPRVVVLSRSAARLLFGSENPLGRRITAPWTLKTRGEHAPGWLTVVGVVADVRTYLYESATIPQIYMAFGQGEPGFPMQIVARTRINSSAVEPTLRRALKAVDPTQKIPTVKILDRVLSDSVAQRRQRAWLLGVFAASSLLVAMVGVYGVVVYSAARRTHEIGVRMALGADRGDVRRMILAEGLRLAFLGGGVGLALTLAISRALQSLLFGVGPRDMVTFVLAAATLSAAVCLASYLPARQATRVDPAAALRRE